MIGKVPIGLRVFIFLRYLQMLIRLFKHAVLNPIDLVVISHFRLKILLVLVAKTVPGGAYNYMAELHISPYQRSMIAEINNNYDVDMILMDGMKAFVDKGPEQGHLVEPNLLMMSTDRIAIDAVGVSILRHYGTTRDISKGKIFES